MKGKVYLLVTGLVVGFLFTGCSPKSELIPTLTPGPIIPSSQTWEDEWQKILIAAKKEGTVVLYSPATEELRTALSQSFWEKFGVQIEFVTGRANELATKILSERRAGLYIPDMIMMGTSTPIPVLKPQGVLEPVDKYLILPEVLDKSVWWSGDLLWIEPDHLQLVFVAYVVTSMFTNTQLVRPGEVKGYRDLLNPKWKGKIVMDDPTVSGSGQAFFQSLVTEIMDLDYMYELAKQEPVILRDARLMFESLSRGKYAIQIAGSAEEATKFKKLGAPIEFVAAIEGGYVSASTGGLSVPNRAPHPNATKLFLNWILTREGLTVFSKTHGGQTTRLDIPTEFLEPDRVRQPGRKYVATYTLEFSLQRPKYSALAKEVFGIK